MPTIQYSARSTRPSVQLFKLGVSKDNKWAKYFDIRRIATVDRQFNVIRQVMATCPPMRAHWCHLANTIELVHPLAHRSPQPKRQINRFSRFCTAHSRKSLYFTMGDPFPKNCLFLWGIWTPSNSWFFLAILSPQSKRHVDQFSRFCRVH